jgi:hypothetical protein
MGVHGVRQVARLDVEPAHVGAFAVPVDHAEAGAVVVVPPPRRGAGLQQRHVEHDGGVVEDGVVRGDGEVVHHRRSGHLDDAGVRDATVGVGSVVRQVRRAERVPEEEQLAGRRARLRMGRHRTAQVALEVVGTDGVELGGELVREAALLEREETTGVLDDVGVGGGDVRVGGAGCRRLAEHRRADVAVAVPAGGAVLEGDAVHHPVAGEQVRRPPGARVGAVPVEATVQLGRELADDPEAVEDGRLLAHRCVVAFEVEHAADGLPGEPVTKQSCSFGGRQPWCLSRSGSIEFSAGLLPHRAGKPAENLGAPSAG